MSDYPSGGTFSYNGAGSNTLVEVSNKPLTVYHIRLWQNGGSAGYFQVYNNGTAAIAAGTTIGTPDFVIPLATGTSGAGTPAFRDISYGPFGRRLQGLSYLWAAGGTGTVGHGVNVGVDIGYKSSDIT